MTDTTRGTDARTARARAAPHFMKATAAVELLLAQHGEETARKIALQEQQKAGRARSRWRFNRERCQSPPQSAMKIGRERWVGSKRTRGVDGRSRRTETIR
jgi:hypothetical protein